MTSNNVLEFPRHKIVRDGSMNIEELQKMKAKSLKNFADALVQEMTENILMDFDNYGIDIESDTFIKDFHYLVAILSATIYRTVGMEHDLHPFLDTKVKLTFTEDEEQVDLTDN
jgi:hypothetical protein